MKIKLFSKNKKEQKKLPKYVRMRPRVDNSKVLAVAQKRSRKNGGFSKIKEELKKVNLKVYVSIIVSILIVASVALVIVFFRTTDVFNIRTINLVVDKQEGFDSINKILEQYKGRNVFAISLDELEQSIKSQVVGVDSVFIDRSLLGTLSVEVVEQVPVFFEANSSGIYLINQSGVVMEVVGPKSPLEFTETEELIRGNLLPPDSDQVRLRYLDLLSEEERGSVIWKDVPLSEKERVLDQMKGELETKISDYNAQLAEQLKEDRFRDLIGSYISNSITYNVGDKVDLENLNFISIVLDFFKSKGFVVAKSSWQSGYTLEVILESGQRILFSVKRSYTDQFEDLNTLIYHGQINGAKIIDIRSSNYSVVR